MLISYSNNFIYFKAVKVAGTSVQVALAKNCMGPRDIMTPIAHKPNEALEYEPKNYTNNRGEKIYFSHDPPLRIRQTIDNSFI